MHMKRRKEDEKGAGREAAERTYGLLPAGSAGKASQIMGRI